jgi:HPt (histidine-containing phosphotransfer) domain-containing protein
VLAPGARARRADPFQAKAEGRNRVCGDVPTSVVAAPERTLPPGGAYPAVTVDPCLVERIPAFLAETQAEVRMLSDALHAANFDRIRLLGHRLQVTARASGLEEIARLGARLDTGARDADAGTIQAAIDELAAYVAHVQVVYRRTGER